MNPVTLAIVQEKSVKKYMQTLALSRHTLFSYNSQMYLISALWPKKGERFAISQLASNVATMPSSLLYGGPVS